jgi:hypothetical protein
MDLLGLENYDDLKGWGSSLRLTFDILQEESNVDLTPNFMDLM